MLTVPDTRKAIMTTHGQECRPLSVLEGQETVCLRC